MSAKDFYSQDIRKKLMEELKLSNSMALPRIVKVVVNVGAGEAVTNKNVITHIQEQMTLITGQKPIVTKARKSISAFKVRKGMPLGVKTTLRGKKMYAFLEKLIRVVIPRLRDFRGVNDSNIDNHGNLNLGFAEQTIFHEIDFDKIDKIRGLEVTVVTNIKDKQKGKKMYEILGVPFKK
ncbi:MAG: 50S ribosomal protein L5 [bacterium]|nr:50S ribosomal protein L5 [bacterium]